MLYGNSEQFVELEYEKNSVTQLVSSLMSSARVIGEHRINKNKQPLQASLTHKLSKEIKNKFYFPVTSYLFLAYMFWPELIVS